MNNTYLYHHGIKGQKWGVRRYQNKDGSLKMAGKNKRIQSVDSKYIVKGMASGVLTIIGSRAVAAALETFDNSYLTTVGGLTRIFGVSSGLTEIGITAVEGCKGKRISELIKKKE